MIRRPTPAPGELPARLRDPLNDRQVLEVPPPSAELLAEDVFWTENGSGVPRLELLQEHLKAEGLLTQELLLDLINRVREEFLKEPNLLKLDDPISIVGDIHGQYYDMQSLIEVGGPFATSQYLFLGDYVDRGSFSIEVVSFLYAVKLSYPNRVHLLRGNHESRTMTSYFNFRQECEFKYDISVYDALMDSFDAMPIAAIINAKFLAVHGGLSPKLNMVQDIVDLDRFQEPPAEGLLCDLLWSDPRDDLKSTDFGFNERGCAYYFSCRCANRILAQNRLLCLIRAHEVQLEGFKMHTMNPATGFPSVITIFSAPNYCDAYGNRGAVLRIENATCNVLQFNFTEHPYHLTTFMGVLEWSMPFIGEKIADMLTAILSTCDDDQDDDEEAPSATGRVYRNSLSTEGNAAVEIARFFADRANLTQEPGSDSPEKEDVSASRMRVKAWAVARMAHIYKKQVRANENIVRLKGVCPGHRLSVESLLAGKEAVTTDGDLFEYASTLDVQNERHPTVADPVDGPAVTAVSSRKSVELPATAVSSAVDKE